MQRAQKKLFLDAMVNRGSTAGGMKRDKMDTKAMLETLSFGMDRVFNKSSDTTLTEDDIDRIIDRTRTDSEIELKSLSNAKQTASTFDESSSLVALRQFQGQVMGDRKNDDNDDDDNTKKEDSGNQVEEKRRRRRRKRNERTIEDGWIEEIATSGSSRKRKERFVRSVRARSARISIISLSLREYHCDRSFIPQKITEQQRLNVDSDITKLNSRFALEHRYRLTVIPFRNRTCTACLKVNPQSMRRKCLPIENKRKQNNDRFRHSKDVKLRDVITIIKPFVNHVLSVVVI